DRPLSSPGRALRGRRELGVDRRDRVDGGQPVAFSHRSGFDPDRPVVCQDDLAGDSAYPWRVIYAASRPARVQCRGVPLSRRWRESARRLSLRYGQPIVRGMPLQPRWIEHDLLALPEPYGHLQQVGGRLSDRDRPTFHTLAASDVAHLMTSLD